MRMIAAILLLCLSSFSNVHAQAPQGYGAGMEAGFLPPAGPQARNAKFIILLGPDLKPGEKPFLDPYEMSRQPIGNVQVPTEAISVDVVTPLPTKPGVSVQVRHPAASKDTAELQKITKDLRLHAIRFGITQVEFTPTDEQEGIDTRVRIGLSDDGMYGGMGGLGTGIFSGIDLGKYVAAAAVLNPDNPTIELFDERPLRAKQVANMGMGGYGGGMGMMESYDMGGDGSMGMMGGPDMGSGDGEAAASKGPSWAETEGTVTGSELVVSWSLEQGHASAIGLQSGGRWVPIKLSGAKMTQPIVEGSICAFYCDDTAFAFSAKVGRWDTLKLKSAADPAPPIASDGQSAAIKTDDDLHIFTAVSGRWAARSQAGKPSQRDMADPFGGSTDIFGGGSDPFASAAQTPDPFGPANPSSRASDDPFGSPPPSQLPADPFARKPRKSQSPPGQDPFAATPLQQDPFTNAEDSSISELNTQTENLRQKCKDFEARLEQLSRRYNETTDEKEKAAVKKQLADMVAGSFDLKKALQSLEVKLLAKKFSLIGDQLRLRERHRDALIQQRIEELTAGAR